MRNSKYTVFGLVGLGMLLTACGLSKSDARAIIEKENYSDAVVTCQFTDFTTNGSGAGQTFESSRESRYCVWAMGRADVLDAPPCEKPSGGICDYAPFKLKNGATYKESQGSLRFPCGTKSLGEVLSVTTEGKKARVRYKRTVTLDKAKLEKLQSCSLKIPKDGEEEVTIEFTKDDDGNWTTL